MTMKQSQRDHGPIERALRSAGPPILWDGGIGTALIARGLELAKEPPEAWLWSHPDELLTIHRGFVDADVDVLQTNSFGLVRLLASDLLPRDKLGQSRSLRAWVGRSVELARQAMATDETRSRWLVAALGPTGQVGLSTEHLRSCYRAVTEAFAEQGVDALHLETCFDPSELRLALSVVREVAPSLPLFVSVTVTHGQQGLETPLGVPLARMLQELDAEPPELLGVNCSQNAERMRGAVTALADWAQASGRKLPVLARPQLYNGSPDCKRPPKEISPERFARELFALLGDGATAIGGCCGVTAEHLAAVRQTIEGFFSPPSTL